MAARKARAAASASNVIIFHLEKEGSPYREFSNFYRHSQPFTFVLPPCARAGGLPESVPCLFSEKAIMVTKAAMMGDLEMFHEIVDSPDPKSCKALGRGVRNFDEALWSENLEEVAFQVVLQKFQAEPALRRLLLSTGTAILAEAAPNDRIWGVGLGMTDARAKDPAQWQGRNVLGSALMRAREHLSSGGPRDVAEPPSGAVTATAPAPPDLEDDDQRQASPQTQSASDTAASCLGGSPRAEVEARPVAAPAADTGAAPIFDSFAVLDFEATCEDGRRIKPQEVIEFPLVLVDATGSTVGEFRSYVRPVCHPRLSAFCTNLTGITQASVDEAPEWSKVLHMAQTWLDGQLATAGFLNCAFVTCGDWDLKTMIGEQCGVSGEHVPARFRQWINIKHLFERLTKQAGGSMPRMLELLHLKLEGRHHSGLDDCRNIARILQVLLRRGGVLESDLSHSDQPEMHGSKQGGQGRRSKAKRP